MPKSGRNSGKTKVVLSKSQYEKLSKSNAKKLIWGIDKLKSRGHTGWVKSERLNKWYKYRSMIEAKTIQQLDAADDYIEVFDSEPFMIEYKMGDKDSMVRNYVPDFVVKTTTGKLFVIEVKPYSQLKEEKNIAKWATAKTWCWNRGARFLVITEHEIESEKIIELLKMIDSENLTEAEAMMKWSFLN